METAPRKVSPEPSHSSFPRDAPPLPLGWTRVKRKHDGDDDCNCDDPSCLREGGRPRRPAPLSSATVASSAVSSAESTAITTTTTYRGTAIICLHESNPAWFQGYFFHQPSSSGAPSSLLPSAGTRHQTWGILGEQQEVDDCMRCADGGYRVLKLTLYPFSTKGRRVSKPNNTVVVPNVEWTGGEMIRLLQPDGRVRMEPQHLWTEGKAVPYVHDFFGSLVRQLSSLLDHQDGSDGAGGASHDEGRVLNLMPDVAIIVGAMELVLPDIDDQNH